MGEVLTSFINTLVGGISTLAGGIGEGVNQYVQDLFLVVENGSVTGLSTFGGVVAIFGK